MLGNEPIPLLEQAMENTANGKDCTRWPPDLLQKEHAEHDRAMDAPSSCSSPSAGSDDPYQGHARGRCVKCGMMIHNGVQHRKYCHPNDRLHGQEGSDAE